jgi:hypothetical protein
MLSVLAQLCRSQRKNQFGVRLIALGESIEIGDQRQRRGVARVIPSPTGAIVKPQSGPPDWLGGLLVLAFSLTLIMTLLISTFTPAVGTYYGLKVDPAQFTSLDAPMYSAQLRDILALRDGSLRHLELFKITGIVSFPSFHAASAVLYIWALWPAR